MLDEKGVCSWECWRNAGMLICICIEILVPRFSSMFASFNLYVNFLNVYFVHWPLKTKILHFWKFLAIWTNNFDDKCRFKIRVLWKFLAMQFCITPILKIYSYIKNAQKFRWSQNIYTHSDIERSCMLRSTIHFKQRHFACPST